MLVTKKQRKSRRQPCHILAAMADKQRRHEKEEGGEGERGQEIERTLRGGGAPAVGGSGLLVAQELPARASSGGSCTGEAQAEPGEDTREHNSATPTRGVGRRSAYSPRWGDSKNTNLQRATCTDPGALLRGDEQREADHQ
ncbi:unnamed protein product [Prorocentrum cordatum]|uniref:Uncharacterized protein n=1 Tax=Prorocentrum cordatum TaxID=2364126 RepID=A0ABN9VCB8_9DINO|nr:unnamed protein product [Polarella glacialis]